MASVTCSEVASGFPFASLPIELRHAIYELVSDYLVPQLCAVYSSPIDVGPLSSSRILSDQYHPLSQPRIRIEENVCGTPENCYQNKFKPAYYYSGSVLPLLWMSRALRYEVIDYCFALTTVHDASRISDDYEQKLRTVHLLDVINLPRKVRCAIQTLKITLHHYGYHFHATDAGPVIHAYTKMALRHRFPSVANVFVQLSATFLSGLVTDMDNQDCAHHKFPKGLMSTESLFAHLLGHKSVVWLSSRLHLDSLSLRRVPLPTERMTLIMHQLLFLSSQPWYTKGLKRKPSLDDPVFDEAIAEVERYLRSRAVKAK
jgi:hypothetical protein